MVSTLSLTTPGSFQYTFGSADALLLAFMTGIVIVVHDIFREFVWEVCCSMYHSQRCRKLPRSHSC